MKKKLIISMGVLLLFLLAITKVTVKIEGELYLSCEETNVTFPFKHSISTRMYGLPTVKKEGEKRAEKMMASFEKMLEGANAEYEIIEIKITPF